MMDGFIFTSTLLSIGKLTIALGFLLLFAKGLERSTGLDMEGAINALEDAAKAGNALPMAIFLAAMVITLGGILQRFL